MLQLTKRVIKNTKIQQDIYLISISWDKDAKPGQFVMVKCGDDTLLRRPFSIHSISDGELKILYQVKGKGTKFMQGLKKGSSISIIGPLGNGFTIPRDTSKALIVGGGVGIAPLLFLLEKLNDRGIHTLSLLGFKEKPFRVEAFEKFSKTLISTESGTYGEKGTVIEILREINLKGFGIVYGCGPKPMLRSLRELTNKEGIKCQISLEERMGCGIGACLSCVCMIRDKNGWSYKRVCKEGPIFWAKDVMI